MTKFVPYLTEEAIEDDAVALLAEYAKARGVITASPIPIEDIVSKLIGGQNLPTNQLTAGDAFID
jgi:hypothetical protein